MPLLLSLGLWNTIHDCCWSELCEGFFFFFLSFFRSWLITVVLFRSCTLKQSCSPFCGQQRAEGKSKQILNKSRLACGPSAHLDGSLRPAEQGVGWARNGSQVCKHVRCPRAHKKQADGGEKNVPVLLGQLPDTIYTTNFGIFHDVWKKTGECLRQNLWNLFQKMGYQRHIEIFANVTSRRSTGTNILFYSYPFLFRNINFALQKWKQAQFRKLILGTCPKIDNMKVQLIWFSNWTNGACVEYETWGNDSGSQGRPPVTYPPCWVQDWRWTGPHPRSWQRTAAPSPCWCIVSPRWRDPWRTRKEWMKGSNRQIHSMW